MLKSHGMSGGGRPICSHRRLFRKGRPEYVRVSEAEVRREENAGPCQGHRVAWPRREPPAVFPHLRNEADKSVQDS